jgi:small conductance mechanosensitive channel
VQDTLAVAGPDSLGSDTTVVDSVGAIEELAQNVGETGRLLATGQWDLVWNRLVGEGTDLVITFVPRLVAGLFVGLVFFALYRVAYRVTHRIMDGSPRVDSGLQNLALKSLQIVGLGLIGLLILAQLGLNVTALIAGLGITGLALGFAAKDTLENFISGITILLDKPFRVGETVRIEDVYGTVEEISLRSTWIRTAQSQIMVMPNTLMINQKLINFSRHGVLRIDIDFGIAYKESIEAARAVVLGSLEGDDRILVDPAPDVVVTELDDSSVNVCLRMFVADARLEYPLRFEYLEKLREALRSADIEIPFPHMQLFIDGAKAFDQRPVGVRIDGE